MDYLSAVVVLISAVWSTTIPVIMHMFLCLTQLVLTLLEFYLLWPWLIFGFCSAFWFSACFSAADLCLYLYHSLPATHASIRPSVADLARLTMYPVICLLCSAYCLVPAGPPPANGCQALLNLYPASYQLSNCLTAVCQIQGLLLPPAILAIWSISDKAPAMLLTSMIGWTPYKHLYLLVLLQPLEPGL